MKTMRIITAPDEQHLADIVERRLPRFTRVSGTMDYSGCVSIFIVCVTPSIFSIETIGLVDVLFSRGYKIVLIPFRPSMYKLYNTFMNLEVPVLEQPLGCYKVEEQLELWKRIEEKLMEACNGYPQLS